MSESTDLISSEVEFDEDPIASALTELLDDQASELRVFQTSEDGKELKRDRFMFTLQADEYSFSQVMERCRDYGTGDYRVDLRINNKWAKKRTFSVKALPKNDQPVQVAPPAQNNSEIIALITAMDKNSQEAREQGQRFMQLMMDNQVRSAENQNNMLLKMMEIQGANNSNNANNSTDLLSVLTFAKEFMSNNDSNPVELFLNGFEFGRDMGDSDPLSTAVKTLGVPLARMTEKMQSEKKEPQKPYPNNVNPNESQTTETPSAIPPLVKSFINQYKPQVQSILIAAANSLDQEAYCDMILDILYAKGLQNDAIYSVLNDDNNFNKLFEWIPQAARFKDWFDVLRAVMLHTITQEPDNYVPSPNNPEPVRAAADDPPPGEYYSESEGTA